MAVWQEGDSNTFRFDLTQGGSFLQLVNNEYLADIRFKVGQSGKLIYAHKLILTMASEVFHTQFNGRFAESKRNTLIDPIAIDDIEPEPFLELMRYIYGRKVNIQPENLLDIYYASEKYMLRNLGMICEDKFYQQINETTVLKMIQHNRLYGFAAVDTLCLEIICKNPLKYFNQEYFLTLSLEAVQLIASSRAMNCRVDQLDKAITQWKQSKEKILQDRPSTVTAKQQAKKRKKWTKKLEVDVHWQKFLCRKLYFYDKCAYSLNIDTHFILNVDKNHSIALYGLGIYVGVEKDSPTPNSTVAVSVTLNGFSVEGTFPVLDELKIYDLMFERQLIDKPCQIIVKVVQQGDANQRKLFHLDGWSTMDDDTILKVTGYAATQSQYQELKSYCNTCRKYSSCSYCRRRQINCVAYLLCTKETADANQLGNSA